MENILLNGKNLVNYKHDDIKTSGTVFLKKVYAENTNEEKENIKSLQNNLRKVLLQQRISKIKSKADWDFNSLRSRVCKKDGNWSNLGTTEKSECYINSYETLNLIETNRLHLYNNKTIVSLEQAYHLAFHNKTKEDFKNYPVYSHFMRSGCLLKDTNKKNQSNINYSILVYDSLNELLNNAQQNTSNSLEKIKNLILNTSNITKNTHIAANVMPIIADKQNWMNFTTNNKLKRKFNEVITKSNKKPKLLISPENFYLNKSYEDIYKTLSNKFTKTTINSLERRLDYKFNLYFINNKKIDINKPDNKLLILRASDKFLSSTEINYLKSLHNLRKIIIIYLSDVMSIHGFEFD